MNQKGKNNPNYGHKWTIEMKNKLSKKFKGQKHSPKTEFKKGMIPWNKNKHLSKKIRSNISIAHKKLCTNKKHLKKIIIRIRKANRKWLAKKIKIFKKCSICQHIFFAGYKENKYTKKRKFCSRKCVGIWSRIDMKRREKIRKTVSNQIIGHHIDANQKNNNISNKLRINAIKHRQLHEFAYHYLVELGRIDEYIKWFSKKYGLKILRSKDEKENKKID